MVVLYYPERAWLAIGQPPPFVAATLRCRGAAERTRADAGVT
jgi:hypothetical protein